MVVLEPFAAVYGHDPARLAAMLTHADPGGGFATAAAHYRRARRDGTLTVVRPALWGYEADQPDRGGAVLGVLGAVRPDDQVVPHESVDPARVALRRSRLAQVPVDVTPVLLVVDALDFLPEIVRDPHDQPNGGRDGGLVTAHQDGVWHRTWPLSGRRAVLADRNPDNGTHRRQAAAIPTSSARAGAVTEALRGVVALVADGHHRLAAARALGHLSVLALVVAGADLRLRALHRVVGQLPPDWPRRLSDVADVRPLDQRDRAAPPLPQDAVTVWTPGAAWTLRPRRPGAAHDPSPPAVPADRGSLADFWDRACVPRLEVGPARDLHDTQQATAEAARAGGTAVLFPAVTLPEVAAAARGGRLLPARTTHFTPKPCPGLVLRPHGERSDRSDRLDKGCGTTLCP